MKLTSKHYTEADFNNCTPSCSMQDMNQSTINMIDRMVDFLLQNKQRKPRITCAYRTPEWDRARGRTGTGAHTKGMAVDLSCSTSRERFWLDRAINHVNCRRFGFNFQSNFVHVDNDTSLDQDVLFPY